MKINGKSTWMGNVALACSMVALALVMLGSSVRADEAMAYIPADVDVVGSVNVGAIYAHGQMGSLRGMVEEGMDDEEGAKFKAMKVFPDNIQRVTFGVKIDGGEGEPAFAVVMDMKEGIHADDFAALLKEKGEELSVGGKTVYADPGGAMQVAILSPKRVVAASAGMMEAALSKANPVSGNAKLMQAAAVPARKESLWVAMVPGKEMIEDLPVEDMPFLKDFVSALLTVNMAEKLDIAAVTNFANEESAAAMMDLMQMVVPQAMMMGAQMGIEIMPQAVAEGNAAKLTISTTPDALEKAAEMLPMLLFDGMMQNQEMMIIEEDFDYDE